MRLGRFAALLLALPLLSGLLGCDVAVIALLASKGSSKSKNSAPPAPDFSFAIFVRNFPNPGAVAAEAVNLEANGGNPDLGLWSLVARATATQICDAVPGGNNTVLIQGPLNQVYNIDAFESLNANGAVIEVPQQANIFANSAVTTPLTPASGMLDGVAVSTKITDPTHSPCLLAFFNQPIARLRVRAWGTAQDSGDCVWAASQSLPGTISVGGAGTDALGNLTTTYQDNNNNYWLLRYSSTGTPASPFNVASNASASGNIAVAVNTGGDVYVGSTLSTGQIQLQKFASGIVPAQWTTLYTGVALAGANFIRSNGLAVASDVSLLSSPGNLGTAVFIAGGQGTSGSHTIVRFDDTPSAGTFAPALVWGPKTLADPASKTTTWAAVATAGAASVLTTGNLNNNTSGNIEILSQSNATDTGNVNWPSPITTTGAGASTNSGNAVAVDSNGFAYVAGSLGGTNAKDSVVMRYKVSDGSGLTTLYQNTVFSGINEFLGIAADADGTTYAVGYVTHSDLISTTAVGAVTSMWIGKFPPSGGLPTWTATFNAGTGNDQAISVSLSGAYVYVVGQNAIPGPKNGMKVFKFVK